MVGNLCEARATMETAIIFKRQIAEAMKNAQRYAKKVTRPFRKQK